MARQARAPVSTRAGRLSPTYATRRVLLAGSVCALAAPAWAQSSARSVPPARTLARLVWTVLITLDNANRLDDYSILRRLGSPGFQRGNSAAALSARFAGLRNARVDVGRVIHQNPQFFIPPSIDAQGRLRLRGGFDDRPRQIRFDMVFARDGGAWRLDALSVVDMDSDAPR